VSSPVLPSAMCSAALQYARRGWPVFPCRERAETVTIGGAGGKTRTFNAKAPYTGQGLKDATCDEARILDWWRRYPDALIGLPVGERTGVFVLDFDPRVEEECDRETGEVVARREWTLEQLKAELEAQIGCALPRSVTAITQSGGVHVYLRQPAGEPIRNKGSLPEHVDVRGEGGYVIAPPSVMADTGKRYRWMDRGDWRDDAAFAEAPAALVEILRAPKRRDAAPARPRDERPSRPGALVDVDDAVRKYAIAALDGECREIRQAGTGRRNAQLNESAFKIATLVAAGAIDAGTARAAIESAARANPGRDDDGQLTATIESGWTAGYEQPRDLAEIAAAARSRRERTPPRDPSARRTAPPAQAAGYRHAPFRSGSMDGLSALPAGERANVVRVAERWLERRLAQVDRTKSAIERLAYGAGRRIAAGLLDGHAVRETLWAVYETVADLQHADVDRSIDAGAVRGFDLEPLLLTLRCAGHPMTDFGIAERFRDRFGGDYRFTTGKGWLGWDGRRWKVLDQDEKTLPAEVISAVFETVRAIQDEARLVADTGVRVVPSDGEELDLDQPHPFGLDRLIPKGKSMVTLSSMMVAWGRQSETTGKPAAVALLARRWLTVPIERFDHDAYAFNVQNGTLRFRVVEGSDGKRESAVELTPHAREDMLTKLSPVEYVPGAVSPRYDKMLAWAQPDGPMRRYLHQLGGLSLTGDAGEQKLWFWYGRGRNGKGTTLDVWQHVVGDYADTIPIGSFLDQGIKKRGDQASPDLAKLAGVRLLRSSEPGRNEKLDSGLIKLVTGGDPVPVRMLHRGFFNLQPLFKLIIMGNTRFDIPDTDDGIWSRMKLIPWARNIEKPEPGVADWPEKDPKLPAKIIAEESAGVLNRLVAGLLDYMAAGLVEPSSVTEATSAYRDQSDPLARFLRLCVVADPESRVQSSRLHEVFVAWCKAAGEREWSNKGLSNALVEKGYQKKASDGMQWLSVRLVREVHDFVDADGKPRTLADDPDLPDATARPFAPPAAWDDDDLPP
jgi:putative DNA primase/helicase